MRPLRSLPAVPLVLCATLALPASAERADLFTSRDQVGDAVAAAVGRATGTIDLALYALKLPKATEVLAAKARAGVKIRLVVDAGHADAADVGALVAAGVEVRKLAGLGPRGLMHNKIALVDGAQLVAGSFNWTTAADELNLENAVLRDDPALIKGFSAYWAWMWQAALPLDAPAAEAQPRGPPPADPAPGIWFKGEAWPAYAFSPSGGVEALLVKAVERSNARVEVAMFSFFSQNLADALIAAQGRGARVRVVADKGQAANSAVVATLVKAGVPIRFRSGRAGAGVLPHKFALFDGEMLETGSFNWTVNAEKNSYENALFSTAPQDLSAFEDEFDRIYAEAASS